MEIDPSTVKIQGGGNVKAEVKIDLGLPLPAKLSHVLAVSVGGVIALCVAAVLADGLSVIKLKPPEKLPIATAASLRSDGIHHRLDQLLGPTYGVGLHHDQSGKSWTEIGAEETVSSLVRNLGIPVIAAALPTVIATDGLKHPVPLLECDDLQRAGLAAVSLGFIAEVVAVLMIIFHGLALAGVLPPKPAKVLGALVWFVLTAGFGTVIILACGIYTAVWTCHNPIIPSIRLSDHFEYNYGFYFAIAGFVSALLTFAVVLFFTTTTDGASPSTSINVGASAGKALLVVLVGVGAITAGALSTVGGTDGFDASINIDPNVNPCYHQKPYHALDGVTEVHGDNYFSNTQCVMNAVTQTLEQAGGNVTAGYVGGMDAGNRVPITDVYSNTDLCPVNVHWHLGAEHLSVGQFDTHGTGPNDTWAYPGSSTRPNAAHRQLGPGATSVRMGNQCHHYDATDTKFTTPYNWQNCTHMEVGQTYEIHWPHSAAGMCGTDWQYQSPFYDGVFCKDGIISIAPLNTYKKIGVQAQIFTIVNSDDAQYYQPNLINGMIVDASKNMGTDMAKYTGSTTGTSRDNNVCSRYTPVTWQVDRKCHIVSASSFDKLCGDMLGKRDDMSSDVHPHGAREVVAHHLTANNQQSRK